MMDKIIESLLRFLRLDGLLEHITGYVEDRIELIKLEIREDVSRALSRALVILLMMLFAFMVIIFLSIGLAHYINVYFQGAYSGYWIVAGIYFFFFLIVLVFRSSILAYFEHYFSDMIKHRKK